MATKICLCVIFVPFFFLVLGEDIKSADINVDISTCISFMAFIQDRSTTQRKIHITLPLFTQKLLVVKRGQV